jgi:hypothetical protein
MLLGVLRRLSGRATVLLVASFLVAGCAGSATSTGASPVAPLSPSVGPLVTNGGQWTGLQWRDVTATAGDFFGHRAPPVQNYGPYDPAKIVVCSGGVAMIGGPDRSVWTSPDGLTWTKSPRGPAYAGPIGWNGMLAAGRLGGDAGSPWASTDALTWRKAPIRFNTEGCQQVGECIGLTAGPQGIIAVNTEGRMSVMDPGTPYLSTDGVTWTPRPLPEDANEVAVHAFMGGFIAAGSVHLAGSPAGSFVPRVWRSPDGINWTAYRASRPGVANDQWPYWGLSGSWPIVEGPLGAEDDWIHTTDGVTWTEDTEFVEGGAQMVSDGARIIGAQTWLSRFYLSEGDGRWRELEQGGDIGRLPAGGYAFLLPNGLIWVAGERVFFGRALAGTHPSGSLVPWLPSPTPWPGPS